jgi:hypothetical protein
VIEIVIPLRTDTPPAEVAQLMDFIEKAIHQHVDILPGARVSVRDIDRYGINIAAWYEIKKFAAEDAHLYPNENTKISGVRSYVYMAILTEMARRHMELASVSKD